MKLLESVLRLDPERLEALAARWHIVLDPKKRLTMAEQVARGLVLVPRWLEPGRLSEGAREAVRLLAAAPRGLSEDSLPGGLRDLLEEGFLFRDAARPERICMPSAYRLQLPASPSDSPRASRLLLQGITEEARRELCHHHLKRVPPLPWPMLLEPVLERLEDAEWIKHEIASASEGERALLWAIDALGGEVSGEEVLELEREPVRIAHGGSVQVPRRSAIYGLARRGLVLTRKEGWVVPDEVERVVGRERRKRAGIERQRLLMSRHTQELTPARAVLAEPAGPLAVALMANLASASELPSEGRGLSKGAVRRAAHDFHVDSERAELLLCLARADGLFSARTSIRSASERLANAWRRGGAWDEAALEPDLFRPGQRATCRATSLIREALLDTLLLVAPGEFALSSDIEAVTCADRRALSAQRALALAARTGQEMRDGVLDVVRVLLERSLLWLGLVDRGQVEQGPVVRLSTDARRWLERAPGGQESRDEAPEGHAEFRDDLRLVAGFSCDVGALIETARYGSVWLEERGIGIAFGESSLAHAADHDPDLAGLRAGLEALGAQNLPAKLSASIQHASEQRPMCTFIRASAFVEIDDPALRDAVYQDPDGAGLWAGSPLANGLLVKPGASASRVHELLTRHGARLYTD
ncbi:MAG: hypothetical protein QM778_01595 [Myxococcales bacterium]